MTHGHTDENPASPPALVAGEPLEALPDDLYIPPDALRVFLENFEGPLDLLLYLVRKQNLDIVDIPVQTIATQYIAYIETMRDMAIELAGEYLLMAATLAEIKSRLMLPRPPVDEDDDEGDPKAELIRRLQDYERFKQAAEALDALPRVGRDVFVARPVAAAIETVSPQPAGDIGRLLTAFADVLARAEALADHKVERERLSVRTHMSHVLTCLHGAGPLDLPRMVDPAYGRASVVVVFVAVLELVREALVEVESNDDAVALRLRLARGRMQTPAAS